MGETKGKTIILIHGRAFKPAKESLEELWLEALKFGVEKDHGKQMLESLNKVEIKFVYFGGISNKFLKERGGQYDEVADVVSRRLTLDQLKVRKREDFDIRSKYEELHGQSSVRETMADMFAGLGFIVGCSEPLIEHAVPDMAEYWNLDSGFGSDIRYCMTPLLRDAMKRDRDIMVIAHSLGTMIAYDTFWKFAHTGEYREYGYNKKKINLFVTLGCPLGNPTVKNNLKGAQARRKRRFPTNVERWVNIAAEDDYICHEEKLDKHFEDMLPIKDVHIRNLALRNGKSNPHHGVGYLIHPRVAKVVADWLSPPRG
eukprot:GHVS01092465.1.p1 GENE.GHVS01092465.1~~GHVS01092465.1.p1  ORF type:complete len:314 (+),score=19.58 GHVS01092465.1:175-1116(+)